MCDEKKKPPSKMRPKTTITPINHHYVRLSANDSDQLPTPSQPSCRLSANDSDPNHYVRTYVLTYAHVRRHAKQARLAANTRSQHPQHAGLAANTLGARLPANTYVRTTSIRRPVPANPLFHNHVPTSTTIPPIQPRPPCTRGASGSQPTPTYVRTHARHTRHVKHATHVRT